MDNTWFVLNLVLHHKEKPHLAYKYSQLMVCSILGIDENWTDRSTEGMCLFSKQK